MKRIPLKFKSEKKHSVRYDTELDKSPLNSIYIMKEYLSTPWPQVIYVTLETE